MLLSSLNMFNNLENMLEKINGLLKVLKLKEKSLNNNPLSNLAHSWAINSPIIILKTAVYLDGTKLSHTHWGLFSETETSLINWYLWRGFSLC